MSQGRRSNHEGTRPRQRADGRWQIDLRIPAEKTTTGRPTRRSFIAPTRAEVVAKAAAARRALEAGTLTDPTRTTLEAWLKHWLEAIAKPRLRETTWDKYRDGFRAWVYGTPEGATTLEHLAPAHIERIYARMRAAGRAEATILNLHRNLSKACKDAQARGMLGTNPVARIQAPKAGHFEPVVLEPATVRALLRDAEQDETWGPSWVVALALGLRQGERLGLCWEDVDLQAGTMVVRRELGVLRWKHGTGCRCAAGAAARYCPDRTGGGYVMMPTKTTRGHRTWSLPGPVVDALARQKELQDRWQVEAGTAWAGFVDEQGRSWDLVFSRRDGGPINNKTDRAAWKEFTGRHGIQDMRVHDARHTAATTLLAMNVAPRVVMELMGWSQMGMLTRYQHLLNDMRVDAAARVEGALWAAEEEPSGPGTGGGVVDLQAFRARRSG